MESKYYVCSDVNYAWLGAEVVVMGAKADTSEIIFRSMDIDKNTRIIQIDLQRIQSWVL